MSSNFTPKHEQIRLEAQKRRAVEASRHEITKLAHELLQERLDTRHAANEKTSFEERARAENEHSAGAALLTIKHEKEDIEFEDARFAMIAEFDTRRDKLLGASLAKKLEEHPESIRHTELLESLQVELEREDQASEQELQKTIERYEQTQQTQCPCCGQQNQRIRATLHQTCFNCGRSLTFGTITGVIQARALAQQSTTERHKTYEQLVDRHKTEWKLRREALRLEVIDNREFRQARLDLEYEFQRRFAEHDQRRNDIRQRHAEELTTLENKRISTLTAVRQAYELEEERLHEERQRVEEWWNHLRDEAEAGLRRIDDKGKTALGDVGCQGVAFALEAEREDRTVQTEKVHDAVADRLGKVKNEDSAEVGGLGEKEEATTTRRVLDEDAPVTGLRKTAISLAATTYRPDDPAITLLDDTSCSGSMRTSVSPSVKSPPTPAMSSPIDDLAVSHTPPPEDSHQVNSNSPPSQPELVGSYPDRSGSPDDGDSESDFVEI